MRQPIKVDLTEFLKMVDIFIENGFNYFDTAHGYLDGKKRNCDKELPYKPGKRLIAGCVGRRYRRVQKNGVPKIKVGTPFCSDQKKYRYFPLFLYGFGSEFFLAGAGNIIFFGACSLLLCSKLLNYDNDTCHSSGNSGNDSNNLQYF